MHSRSFLRPEYAYTISNARKKQQELTVQTPDIFVVPPEEDQTPPWCCYNSQQGLANEDEEEDTLRYPQVSSYTPLFHRGFAGIEGLILPVRGGSNETRSIVDALGDADDFLDHEYDHDGHIETDSEENGDDDGVLPEMVTGYGRAHRDQHHPQEFGVQLRSPRLEMDNDSDIVEIVKVRRKSAFNDDPDNFWVSPGGIAHKSTLRSRATKAFHSLRGNFRTSSRTVSKPENSGGSLSNLRSHSSLGFRPKLQSRPRAQNVFSPVESIPRSEHSHTPELRRRPSSRLSEFFGPALKRRASTASFATSIHKSPTPIPQAREPSILSQQKSSSRPSDGSRTPPRRLSSSTQGEVTSTERGDVPTPTRNHFQQRQSEDDRSTPLCRTSETRNATHRDQSRSISPVPAPRTELPLPGNRQAKRVFSVLNLRKIFQKPAPQSSPDVLPQSMRQTSSGSSTCPSLSSTPTSEWSGRTSPTTDSVPQTPTGFDENEVMRTIVPVQSSTTVSSGISLGSSLQSGAVSCLSSSSVSSEATAATPGHGLKQLQDTSSGTRTVHHGSQANSSTPELSRPSIANSHSTMSTNTADSRRPSSTSGRKSESTISSPVEASSGLPFDMSLHLDLNLDLGLGINMVPSPSGGMLSSNGIGEVTASENMLRKVRGRTNLSRSFSLKGLGDKLGIGKQDVPPVPPLPRRSSSDADFEMRLDSLHFDDMSFDADGFIAR